MAEHSVILPFSSSHRIIACPASVRMSAKYPNEESEHAKVGTAVHALGEYCITFGFNPSECKGLEFNGIKIDDRMIEGADLYVGRIRSLAQMTGVKPNLEQRVTLTSLGRTDVFGSGDSIIVDLLRRRLYIDDYKNGYGVVEVVNNTQLIGYAMATLDTFNLWDKIDTVETTIIQPNASHINGPIRTHSYQVDDLRQNWLPVFIDTVRRVEDKNEIPVAGPHCLYCPARGNCRARMFRVLDLCYAMKPRDELSTAEREIMLSEIPNLKRWIEAIENEAINDAKQGYKFGEFKLVNSITRASCTDEKRLRELAIEMNVDTGKLFRQIPVSMTEAKKHLPWQKVNECYTKPEPHLTLVPMTDNRPAQSVGSAKNVFTPIK